MVVAALIAGSVLLSLVGGVLVVRGNRRRFTREKPDWLGFALGFIGGSLSFFGLAWLVWERGPRFLGSMELFIAVISVGTFVWPPMPLAELK
jgi:hypothetical protein